MLIFLLPVFEAVELRLLDLAPLVELADLTLNGAFQDVELLLHLFVTLAQLFVLS